MGVAGGIDTRTQRDGGQPLLRGKAVLKNYGSVQAVRGVNFEIAANSYVTLLGPSGCGKTSLLRMIGGFEEISSGSIELDGLSLATVPANRRPINTVFQNYALFPHLSVEENVGFGLAYRNLSRADLAAKVGSALAMVQMTQMSKRRPRQLSGGQQQRVALARAIINEPRLLLLDEPLSALDRRMRKDMQIELKDLQRRLGMTFLHVTHDQEEAFALSDRIIVMNHGLIEQQGASSEIYHRPASAYVADFLGGANLVAGTIRSAAEGSASIETAIGVFEVPALEGLKPSSRATLCLRPELLRLSGKDGIAATVTHTVFRGAYWLIEARASNDQQLSAVIDDSPPNAGASIRLTFDPNRAWITAA
ncbi:MAG: ABC transporter ATP-binding protein [Rhizobiaceae bacterium]|nr:ABC transporter ATP-binding protein [Rhizobiaceae bacterium]